MAAPASQPNPLERTRSARLKAGRSSLEQRVVNTVYGASRRGTDLYADQEAARRQEATGRSVSRMNVMQGWAAREDALRSGRQPDPNDGPAPVFGEEGFGDIENRPVRGRDTGGPTEDEPAGDEIGGAPRFVGGAGEAQQTGAVEDEDEDEDALTPEETQRRDAIDALVAKAACEAPVIGHLLWWNLKMIFGSWIKKGNHPVIGPFTFKDVLLIMSPKSGGGGAGGGPGAGAALDKAGANQVKQGAEDKAAKMVPDPMLHSLLVILDLNVAFNLLVMWIIMMLPFFILFMILSDPKGAINLFGDAIVAAFGAIGGS